LIEGDFARSFFAEADWALRVRARISKLALDFKRAAIVAEPCLPVALVMRSARDIVIEYLMVLQDDWWISMLLCLCS
jgi:hypothetical protein